jgi:DNA-binding NtrC family response regulator
VNALTVRGAPTAKELHAALERVARSCTACVLVEAERGIAVSPTTEALHRLSAHAAHPLVVLGRPAELEFAIARAGRGTLVIEDPAALDSDAQARLAQRLAQRRLDGPALECRVVAVLRGSTDLREDLLHRLNGASLRLPPLRERRAEIPARVRELGATEASRDALETLDAYDWPGNDRELELVIERALLLAGGPRIEAKHLSLGSPVDSSVETLPLGDRSLRSVEEALIRRVLAEQSGNKSRSAAVLGLHRATLHQKIRDYRI